MRDNRCEHKVLDGVTVARCALHSRSAAGIEVWMWSARTLPPLRCSCAVADRFVIAADVAGVWHTPSADVVLGPQVSTVAEAEAAASRLLCRLPGCRLVAVPAGRSGTVFRTPDHTLVVAGQRIPPPVCAVCLYPWLSAGHHLDEVL